MADLGRDWPLLSIPSNRCPGYPGWANPIQENAMYYVYDLRRDGAPVCVGITRDPGRALVEHLARGRRFDSVHVLRITPLLEEARRAARDRRYQINPLAGSRAKPSEQAKKSPKDK
jgi:hypothetical protein